MVHIRSSDWHLNIERKVTTTENYFTKSVLCVHTASGWHKLGTQSLGHQAVPCASLSCCGCTAVCVRAVRNQADGSVQITTAPWQVLSSTEHLPAYKDSTCEHTSNLKVQRHPRRLTWRFKAPSHPNAILSSFLKPK